MLWLIICCVRVSNKFIIYVSKLYTNSRNDCSETQRSRQTGIDNNIIMYTAPNTTIISVQHHDDRSFVCEIIKEKVFGQLFWNASTTQSDHGSRKWNSTTSFKLTGSIILCFLHVRRCSARRQYIAVMRLPLPDPHHHHPHCHHHHQHHHLHFICHRQTTVHPIWVSFHIILDPKILSTTRQNAPHAAVRQKPWHQFVVVVVGVVGVVAFVVVVQRWYACDDFSGVDRAYYVAAPATVCTIVVSGTSCRVHV